MRLNVAPLKRVWGIMKNRTGQNDIAALREAIAASGPAPVLLIWIRHRPRVTTLRPVALALHRAGYTVLVGYALSLDTTAEEMGFGSAPRCFGLRPPEVASLEGVAVFITSEQDTRDGPRSARRVGIHHSLPDHNFKRNYAKALSIKPLAVRETDFYAILSVQSQENWTVENYRPFVDRLLPASLLVDRRPAMAIIPFGYPKIDQMMATDTAGDTLDTITYAPTQSILKYSSVREKGGEILRMLLDDFPEYRIAFRPYPGIDVERVRDIFEPFLSHPRFTLDDSPTGEAVLRRSALLISDQSSVAVSFGLGFARPVIFYDVRISRRPKFKALDYFPPIGLRVATMDALKQGIAQVLRNSPKIKERIERRRGDVIYNPGRSLDYLVEIMPDILSGGTRPEWLEIPRRPFHAWTQAAYRAQYETIMARVAASHPMGVAENENSIGPGFEAAHRRLIRKIRRRIARNTQGLRRYLSRPRGR